MEDKVKERRNAKTFAKIKNSKVPNAYEILIQPCYQLNNQSKKTK